jgi:hypothetical protein
MILLSQKPQVSDHLPLYTNILKVTNQDIEHYILHALNKNSTFESNLHEMISKNQLINLNQKLLFK